MNKPYGYVPISQQIAAMRDYGAGSNPMRFEDYRTPMRRSMIIDVKGALLEQHDCPPGLIPALSHTRIRDWPDEARAKVREVMT
jgi:hypothetical protein